MKKRTKIAIVIGAVAGIAVIVLGLISFNAYRQKVAEITIEEVDLSRVNDGVYTGSCDAIFVIAEVKVTVRDNKITGIVLTRHENGKGEPAEVLPEKVVEAQSLLVDMVSGATSSSKVILKAIENALRSEK